MFSRSSGAPGLGRKVLPANWQECPWGKKAWVGGHHFQMLWGMSDRLGAHARKIFGAWEFSGLQKPGLTGPAIVSGELAGWLAKRSFAAEPHLLGPVGDNLVKRHTTG